MTKKVKVKDMQKPYASGQLVEHWEQLPKPRMVALARNIRGVSQGEFGKEIAKSQSVISKYERGEVEPPDDVISHCVTILMDSKGFQCPSLEQVVSKLSLIQAMPMAPYLYQAVTTLIDAFSLSAKLPLPPGSRSAVASVS